VRKTSLTFLSFYQYGTAEASAMATTVGVVRPFPFVFPCLPLNFLSSQPIALGALLILDDKISQRGIVSPSSDEVWRPLLVSLEGVGIKPVEARRKGKGLLESLEKQVEGW
jgi:alpha-aminoadipic semialdehyde synthase